jgi:hypothetical protein
VVTAASDFDEMLMQKRCFGVADGISQRRKNDPQKNIHLEKSLTQKTII